MNKYAVYVAPGAMIYIEADSYRIVDERLSFRRDVPDTGSTKEKAVFASGKWVGVVDCGKVEDKHEP